MSFVFNDFLLSEIKPVKLTYKFNNEEKLIKHYDQFANGFSYYAHKILENHRDSLLSKRNALFLTDTKLLADVFLKETKDSKKLKLGEIGGSFYLKVPKTNVHLTTTQGLLFKGGTGEKALFGVYPLQDGTANLKFNENTWFQVDKSYPYTVRLSQERIDQEDEYCRKFIIEHEDGKIAIKTLTKEGYRYLSFGIDLVVRMVGLVLNETVVNPYVFELDPISTIDMTLDYEPNTLEVKYFNDISKFTDRKSLNVRDFERTDTNLIVSLPTYKISELDDTEVAVNIALAKTYFTPEETYITSIVKHYENECETCGCDYTPHKLTRVKRLTACGDFLDEASQQEIAQVVEDVTITGKTSFVFEYETSTANETFALPLISNSTTYYDFFIEWGDGIIEKFTGYNVSASHSYATPGKHIITIGPPPV
jgi:hypothetical protein